jgi:hypothetical protein
MNGAEQERAPRPPETPKKRLKSDIFCPCSTDQIGSARGYAGAVGVDFGSFFTWYLLPKP